MHSPLRFIPDMFIRRRPVHLTLFVTRRCNARCPFCFYLEQEGETPGGPELSLDEIERTSRSLGPLLWLALSGGEIFLREDLADICRAFYKNNRPSIILLPTNGLMPERIHEMTADVLRSCPESVVAVKVSLDGPEQVHDEMRRVPGSHSKAIRTLQALAPLIEKHQNFELGVNTVFSAENQDHMDGVIDLVKTLPMVKTHTISLVRGDLKDRTQMDVDMEKYHRAAARLAEGLRDGTGAHYRFAGARIKAAQDVIQRRLIHETATMDCRRIPCLAGRINLVVTETGDVYPCETFRDEFLMGNVRELEYDLRAVSASARAKEIIKRIKESCYCTHECYMMTNILFSPRFWPELLREAARIG